MFEHQIQQNSFWCDLNECDCSWYAGTSRINSSMSNIHLRCINGSSMKVVNTSLSSRNVTHCNLVAITCRTWHITVLLISSDSLVRLKYKPTFSFKASNERYHNFSKFKMIYVQPKLSSSTYEDTYKIECV